MPEMDDTDHDEPESEPETTDTETERPDIPADAMAEMDDVAQSVEENSVSQDARSPRRAGAGQHPDPDDLLNRDDGVSMGEIYVRGLTLMAHVVLNKYGDGDGSEFYNESASAGEKIDTTLARELKLDQYVDELMARRGRGDLPPGQALAVGTAMFALAVIATEPAIIDRITENMGEA